VQLIFDGLASAGVIAPIKAQAAGASPGCACRPGAAMHAPARPGVVRPVTSYWRIMAMRISASVSVIRSPERSTVTVWSVPVKGNGAW
jgi:hypothetical protein